MSQQQDVRASVASPELLATVSALLAREERTIECVIRGGSMGATLADGARIRMRCGAPDGIRPGQIVVVAVAGPTLIVHRVVGQGRWRRARDYLVTRGDGAILCDEPMPINALVGTVCERREGTEWRPVPASGRLPWPARALSAGHQILMRAALEAHPGVAHVVAAASFRFFGLVRRAVRV